MAIMAHNLVWNVRILSLVLMSMWQLSLPSSKEGLVIIILNIVLMAHTNSAATKPLKAA